MNDTPLLIDARAAGYLLDMLPVRVMRLAKRGELPCVILPDGEIRFCRADLEQWVAKFRQLPTEVAQ